LSPFEYNIARARINSVCEKQIHLASSTFPNENNIPEKKHSGTNIRQVMLHFDEHTITLPNDITSNRNRNELENNHIIFSSPIIYVAIMSF